MAKICARVAFCCLFLIAYSTSLPADSLIVQNALKEDSHSIYQCPDPTNLATPPICSVKIKEKGQLFQVQTKTVNCPDTGINTVKIGCVIVRDNVPDDKGGFATIHDGGLNNYAVSIFLKSQRSQGLDYDIQVFTVKASNSTSD